MIPDGSYTLFGMGSAPGGLVSRTVVSNVDGSVTTEPAQLLHHEAHCPLIRANIMEHVCLFSRPAFDLDRFVSAPTVTVCKYVVIVTVPSTSESGLVVAVEATTSALLAGESQAGYVKTAVETGTEVNAVTTYRSVPSSGGFVPTAAATEAVAVKSIGVVSEYPVG